MTTKRNCTVRLATACVVALSAFFLEASAPANAAKDLTIAQGGGPTTLDPLREQAGPMMNIWTLLFDGLTKRESDGTIAPALATSWQAISNNLWEFKLRKDVKFHNGEPFNADAVKFTLERILDKTRSSQALTRLPQLGAVEIVDPYTVRIHTKGPVPTFLSDLTWAFMVPPKYIKEKGDDYAAQNPVGTGPFKFLRWRQGQFIEMAANTGYFGGPPKIDKLTVRQIPDDATRMASLMTRESDIVVQIPPDLVKTVQQSGNAHVASVGAYMSMVVHFDSVRGPLTNKKIRQAINYAIDKKSLVNDLLAGQGKPLLGQVLMPGVFGFNPDLTPYPYDPARAKKLLAEAGVAQGLTLTLNTPVGRYIADREIAIAVAGQLSKVGIHVNVVPKEWGLYIKELRSNRLGDMFLIGWSNYGDAGYVLPHFTSRSSFGVYRSNPKLDALVQKARVEIDPVARAHIYKEATELMREAAPAAFLVQPSAIYGVSNKVIGFSPRSDERWGLTKVDLKP
jgi:peptide/nickel transport system substrate-binding protein